MLSKMANFEITSPTRDRRYDVAPDGRFPMVIPASTGPWLPYTALLRASSVSSCCVLEIHAVNLLEEQLQIGIHERACFGTLTTVAAA